MGRLAPPARRIAETAASLVATVFVGFLAIAMARFAWTAFKAGQTSISSGTLLWIPEAVIAFGMVLLALQFLARFIQAAARSAAGGSSHQGRAGGVNF